MTDLTIKIGGNYVWIDAAVVDSANNKTPLDLVGADPATCEIDVTSGKFARLVISASGDQGSQVTADVLRGEKSVCLKRFYKINADGHLDRAVTFDPDA